jgi:hypothetical protein
MDIKLIGAIAAGLIGGLLFAAWTYNVEASVDTTQQAARAAYMADVNTMQRTLHTVRVN